MQRYKTFIFFKSISHTVKAESPAHAIQAAMEWAMQQNAIDLVKECQVRVVTPQEEAEAEYWEGNEDKDEKSLPWDHD